MSTFPLSIVADIPLPYPLLGFEKYSAAIADAIRGGEPPQFTIGVYGPWGSGKSSLLNAISHNLRNDGDIFCVSFDAWRYERSEHIVVPLLHRVAESVAARSDAPLRTKLRRALVSVARSATFSLGPLTINPTEGLSGDRPLDEEVKATLDAAFSRPYQDMREISEALDGRRIVIFIDDLDRCSSGKVVALLEAINLVMDVPGFIFVLALDYDVLVKAVTAQYPHVSGHLFIEKMVQVPLRVPRLEISSETFFEDLIPGLSGVIENIAFGFQQIAFDVASMALDFNPRQIKRFLNSMFVLSRISRQSDSEVDAKLLAGVVGLQLRWPEEYRDLAEAVFSQDSAPAAILHDAEDGALRKYAENFLPLELASHDLQPALSLTRAVVAEPSMDDNEYLLEPASERRERNRTRILAAQDDSEFMQSQPLSPAYYDDAVPGARIKLGTTVVRLEMRNNHGRWKLVKSFLITTQTDSLLKLINSHDALVRVLAEVNPALYR